LITARWNSDTFNPEVLVSSVHEDFLEDTNSHHDWVAHMTPAMATKVKDLISQMQADLMCIIHAWEQSSQGDGGTICKALNDETEEDVAINPEFGALAGRPVGALKTRAGFLKHRPSYLLIFRSWPTNIKFFIRLWIVWIRPSELQLRRRRFPSSEPTEAVLLRHWAALSQVAMEKD
jgi:hypothetical protein